MDHKHFWITDRVTCFGKCRYCSATKQFPREELPELKRNEANAIKGYQVSYDPGGWMDGRAGKIGPI